MKLRVTDDRFQLARRFTISRGSRTAADVLTVCVEASGVRGFGECVPYARYGESPETVRATIESLPLPLDRARLQEVLPPGAARNAVDCALWDLEAKVAGRRVWEMAGLPNPEPVVTAFTLSLDSPAEMAAQAAANAHRRLLKVKLGGDGDLNRLEAVRESAPSARIIIDANEAWTPERYARMAPVLTRLGVEMVEQPLPDGDDDALRTLDRTLPVCADESCHDRDSLPALAGKYDMINIKLDKTGGLTEALRLCAQAQSEGYRIMVGCMVGSSLAMAPAVLVAQSADVVDLDGPLLLAEDRPVPLNYTGSHVHPPDAGLWG
ncbi:MAG: dipeptide epimerase [Paracoccaceae bacterium]|nr:dipeptide epimerase [Paracoccaceae bacterium]